MREALISGSRDKMLEVSGHSVRLAESTYFRLRSEQEEAASPRAPLACKAGCSTCCRSAVGVSPPEALRIAEHLRATRDASALADLRGKLEEVDDATRATTWEERTRLRRPCAFLDASGACTVYAVRPLSCRACTSIDPSFCADVDHTFMPDEVDTLQYDTQRAGLVGILSAIAEARGLGRLEEAMVELQGAVRIALDDPSAAERWLAGEPVFDRVATVVRARSGSREQ
jgi:Fe-S-cluster containining protein